MAPLHKRQAISLFQKEEEMAKAEPGYKADLARSPARPGGPNIRARSWRKRAQEALCFGDRPEIAD